MFQSTLLRRTMSLVVLSLLASAIIATIAFIVAGRSSTLQMEVETSIAQDLKYNEIFSSNPELFDSVDFRRYFFESSYATGHDYYLVNMNGEVVNCTSLENRNMKPGATSEVFSEISMFPYEDLNGMGFYIKELSLTEQILVCRIPLTIEGNPFYLYSMSTLDKYDGLIGKYLNILSLATLMAACAMLVPAYAFVSRMVLPLQKINEVAMEYGKGNFSIRADESHKGEIGSIFFP